MCVKFNGSWIGEAIQKKTKNKQHILLININSNVCAFIFH